MADTGSAGEARRTTRLGAALFNGDHSRLAEEIVRLEDAGLDFVHLDVFDGYFVSDVGFAPRTIASLRPLSRLPFEVHLGVNDPHRFVPQLVDAGVDLILIHVESMRMAHETLTWVRRHEVRVGITISLGTPLSEAEAVLPDLDALLLLSRVAGEGAHGASFDRRVLPRLQKVAQMAKEVADDMDIQVAGGVNRSNAGVLAEGGADSLALGAGIYKAADMAAEIKELRRMLETAAGGSNG